MKKLILFLFLFGCSNPYAEFYTNYLDHPLAANSDLAPYSGETKLYYSGDLNADAEALMEKGYAVIGHSSFNGPAQKVKLAQKKGEEVGADIVLVYSDYTGTTSGAIPWMTPSTSTTHSSGQVGGTIGTTPYTGAYSGTSTTYGTQTMYIPYAISRYDQEAVYLRKISQSPQ